MDTSTSEIGIIVGMIVGALTALTGWFKLFRASRFIEGRLAYLEQKTKDFVTNEQIVERIKFYDTRFGSLELFIKEELGKVQVDVAALDAGSRCFDRDMARLQESLKVMDGFSGKLDDLATLRAEILDKFTKRGDFVREMQIMASQLRLVQQKIDHIDAKLDERLMRK